VGGVGPAVARPAGSRPPRRRAPTPGDTDSTVAVVDDPADLRCLVELDTDEMLVRGDEPRRVMDNWFRADARISGLDRTLRSQGRPLPAAASLYHDLDVTVLTRPFSDWHVRTLGSHLTRRWSTRWPPSGWRGRCRRPGSPSPRLGSAFSAS
jgi:hypothetical protein